MYREWIKNGTKKPGKNAVDMAAFITKTLKLKKPMHRITIYKMISGARKITGDELAAICSYLQEPMPGPVIQVAGMMDVLAVPIEREVGPGVWFEQEATTANNLGTITAPRDGQFPNAKAVAYINKGDSMVDAAILDGDVLICVAATDEALVEGRQVIVERNRAGLIELSPRIVSRNKDKIELRSASRDSNHKPLTITKSHAKKSDETVRVVAIIRRVASKRF